MSNQFLALHWFNTWRIRVETMKSCARTADEFELFGRAACMAQAQYLAALALSGVRAD